jgi:hypothetical protein
MWSLKYVVKALRKRGLCPSLDLLTVASLMPRNRKLRLVDMNVEELHYEFLEGRHLLETPRSGQGAPFSDLRIIL